jgi:transcriptional regulator GlxA family with amidase domain
MARPDKKRPSPARPVAPIKETAPTSVHNIKAKDARIRRALELIHPGPQIRVGNVAATLNLSASGFRHLFKKDLGTPPGQYLKVARLERANELLRNSFLRVKEITVLVGANDISHFVRNYKALYGETPSQTRIRQLYRGAA